MFSYLPLNISSIGLIRSQAITLVDAILLAASPLPTTTMKGTWLVSAVLQLHWLFASTASAYWVRGAVERAMYYMTYMMEEIHETRDSGSGWQIAPNCIGTRTGMRGQTGRCNLAEFVDHIWARTDPDDRNESPRRPTKETVLWPRSMNSVSTMKAIQSQIMSLKWTDKTYVKQDKKSSGPLNYSYTGKINANALWGGSGVTDYYTSLSMFGPRVAEIKREFDEAVRSGSISPANSGDAAVMRTFTAYLGEVRVAAQAILDYRVKDSWDYIRKKGGWKTGLGVQPIWREVDAHYSWQGSWKEIDREATIALMVSESKISTEEAISKYEEHWRKNVVTKFYLEHQSAIDSARNTLDTIRAECA